MQQQDRVPGSQHCDRIPRAVSSLKHICKTSANLVLNSIPSDLLLHVLKQIEYLSLPAVLCRKYIIYIERQFFCLGIKVRGSLPVPRNLHMDLQVTAPLHFTTRPLILNQGSDSIRLGRNTYRRPHTGIHIARVSQNDRYPGGYDGIGCCRINVDLRL
jgi:hypothetical protein